MQGMKTLVGQVLFLVGWVALFLMVLISGGCSGGSSEELLDEGTPPNMNDGNGAPEPTSGPGGRCDNDSWVEPEQGEICDDGNLDWSDACTVCVPARCGDGWLQPLGADAIEGTEDDEECDDGAAGYGNPYDTCLDNCRRPGG